MKKDTMLNHFKFAIGRMKKDFNRRLQLRPKFLYIRLFGSVIAYIFTFLMGLIVVPITHFLLLIFPEDMFPLVNEDD